MLSISKANRGTKIAQQLFKGQQQNDKSFLPADRFWACPDSSVDLVCFNQEDLAMYQVLFATDVSQRDNRAFKLACKIAHAWHARLMILHVENNFPPAKEYVPPALDPKQNFYTSYPQELGLDYKCITRQGDPANCILAEELKSDSDLIVLGTHGRVSFEQIFSGSVTESVIRQANCPVLTVRTETPEETHDENVELKVLVATDFSAHSQAAVDFASLIAHSIEAELTIMHVYDSANDDLDKLKKRLDEVVPADRRVKLAHKLVDGPAAEAIVDHSILGNYDLLVLGTHGRTGVGRVLMGSVAEQIIRNVNCPVFTVKPTNKKYPVAAW